jgi:predicted NUDIX family phosphoesterase
MPSALVFLKKRVAKFHPHMYSQEASAIFGGIEDILKINSLAVKRDICETDPTLLQLIPYVTVINNGMVGVYKRGKSGGEERLHGNYSIGLGGHIDTTPISSLGEHIVSEAARELYEELGFPIEFTKSKLEEALDESKLIYSTVDEVSRVHLGLSLIIDVTGHPPINVEHDVITEFEWIDKYTLEEYKDSDKLELWSSLVSNLIHYTKKTPTCVNCDHVWNFRENVYSRRRYTSRDN